MTCRIVTHQERGNDPENPLSQIRFCIEAEAIHHYSRDTRESPGEDWLEIKVTCLSVEWDRASDDYDLVDGVSWQGNRPGWLEWQITDEDSALRLLAAWGIDPEELDVDQWTGKDDSDGPDPDDLRDRAIEDREADLIDEAYERHVQSKL